MRLRGALHHVRQFTPYQAFTATSREGKKLVKRLCLLALTEEEPKELGLPVSGRKKGEWTDVGC